MTTSKLPSLIGIRSILKVASSVIDGILSIEARDMDTKLLSAPESNNTLARCWFKRNVPVTTFGSRHEKLLILIADCFQWLSAFLTKRKASSIPTIFSWGGSIRTKGFLSFILLLAAIIVAAVMAVLIVVDAIIGVVVAVSGVPYIIKLSFVIIDFVHRIVLCYLIHQPMSYGNGFLQSLKLRGSNISFNTSRLQNSSSIFLTSIQGQYLFVKSLFNSVQVILLACSILIGWAYAFHRDKASSVRVPVANVTLFSSAQLV
ncbi:hypothetical protein Tco_0226360 [Tanacetum coccineum]